MKEEDRMFSCVQEMGIEAEVVFVKLTRNLLRIVFMSLAGASLIQRVQQLQAW